MKLQLNIRHVSTSDAFWHLPVFIIYVREFIMFRFFMCLKL